MLQSLKKHGLAVIVIIRKLEQLFAGGNFPAKVTVCKLPLEGSQMCFFIFFPFSLHTQCLSCLGNQGAPCGLCGSC